MWRPFPGEDGTPRFCEGTVRRLQPEKTGAGQCRVELWTELKEVACGKFHTAGLRENGTVAASGDDREGQCEVSGWTEVASLFCGPYLPAG